MGNDDRPKKSWREIDKARDTSQHRKDDRGRDGGFRKTGPRSQKSYRAALDRLFDSGKIGDLVEDKTGEKRSTKDDDNRFRALRKLKEAVGRDAISKAADTYIKKFGMPDRDIEALGQLLEHRDESVQLDAMEALETRLDAGDKPRRSRGMVGQLKMIRDLCGDPAMEEMARRLIEKL